MGHVKRSPQLANREQRIIYTKMSKADIVEAFRDMFREFGGVDELDDIEWMKDLKSRVALLKIHREQWAKQDNRADDFPDADVFDATGKRYGGNS